MYLNYLDETIGILTKVSHCARVHGRKRQGVSDSPHALSASSQAQETDSSQTLVPSVSSSALYIAVPCVGLQEWQFPFRIFQLCPAYSHHQSISPLLMGNCV